MWVPTFLRIYYNSVPGKLGKLSTPAPTSTYLHFRPTCCSQGPIATLVAMSILRLTCVSHRLKLDPCMCGRHGTSPQPLHDNFHRVEAHRQMQYVNYVHVAACLAGCPP